MAFVLVVRCASVHRGASEPDPGQFYNNVFYSVCVCLCLRLCILCMHAIAWAFGESALFPQPLHAYFIQLVVTHDELNWMDYAWKWVLFCVPVGLCLQICRRFIWPTPSTKHREHKGSRLMHYNINRWCIKDRIVASDMTEQCYSPSPPLSQPNHRASGQWKYPEGNVCIPFTADQNTSHNQPNPAKWHSFRAHSFVSVAHLPSVSF